MDVIIFAFAQILLILVLILAFALWGYIAFDFIRSFFTKEEAILENVKHFEFRLPVSCDNRGNKGYKRCCSDILHSQHEQYLSDLRSQLDFLKQVKQETKRSIEAFCDRRSII